MKSYNLSILMLCMNYRISAIIGIIGIIFAIVSNSVSFAFAANSYCTKLANSDPNTWCVGTEGDDRIGANGLKHNILGLGGSDQIDSGSGDDGVCGGSGNDRINGGDGKDEIFGDIIADPDIPVTCGDGYGSDSISGGSGNDRLYHGLGTPDDSKAILSDGHKDFIDCGPGEDSVWINTSVDHDVASNCEHVHAG
ncbi:MAG: hypothetical protein WB975_15090 [Nitrososphaeraceae archaeon]